MKKAVFICLGLLVLLRQDFWWWGDIEPLVFGFLPVGIAYQVGLSFAAAILWALAVKFAWPADVSVTQDPDSNS